MPKRPMDLRLYESFVIVYAMCDGVCSGPCWVLLRNDKPFNLAWRLCMHGVCANSYLDSQKKKKNIYIYIYIYIFE